jgi:hypothetical protein
MGLYAKSKSYKVVGEGSYVGVCVGIYDIGTQKSEKFGNSQHKIILMFELPEERIAVERDGKMVMLPMVISKQYTLSLNDKSNLRRDLTSWRGKSLKADELERFNFKKLLSQNCTLQITNEKSGEKTYAKIASITPLHKSEPYREPENPLRFFSFDEKKPIPLDTPAWIKTLIIASEEIQTHEIDETADVEDTDDVEDTPFDDVPFNQKAEVCTAYHPNIKLTFSTQD